jgi:hypothetical protein
MEGIKGQKSPQEVHRSSVTDLTKKVSRPPIAIGIGWESVAGQRWPLRFATFGNISLIKGSAKTRKSFAKSLIIACAIGGKANNYCEEITGYMEGKWIIDLDTEQGEYDAWLNATRIPKMVGAIPKNYLNVQLRDYTPTERRQYLQWLCLESEYRDNLGMVFIDGYVDLVKDFNSLEQSLEFTQELMTFSKQANCHISGILHVNYDSTKGRGHLGTIIEQKCESVALVKDMGEYSEFSAMPGRGKKFEPISFEVNNEWLPEAIESVNSLI